jgi:hypothetical protein
MMKKTLKDHIVICWEIGDNLGHVYQASRLAAQLVTYGFKVSVILKDITFASIAFEGIDVCWYQSPVSPRVSIAVHPMNHADILHLHGYHNSACLLGMIYAWNNIFNLLEPSCVITEASPTAGLSASILKIPRINIDNGFFYPPLTHPLTPLRDWQPFAIDELLNKDIRTKNIINECLAHFSTPQLFRLSDLFNVDTYYLNWPELSHFGRSHHGTYLGPIFSQNTSSHDIYNCTSDRCLIYLNTCDKRVETAIQWSLNQGLYTTAYLPSMPINKLDKFISNPKFTLSRRPLNLDVELKDARFIICHGGIGTVTQSIRSGVIPLIIPNHVEQFRTQLNLLKHRLTVNVSTHPDFSVDLKDADAVRQTIRSFAESKENDPGPIGALVATIVKKLKAL